jgi:DNA repair protein RadC
MKTNNFLNEIRIEYTQKVFSSTTIMSSEAASKVAREMYEITESKLELKEYFFMILLNRANRVIGYLKLSEGGICGTVVDQRIAFAAALKGLATGLVLIHNHPSGNLKPSKEDIAITDKFRKIAELLDMRILDHLIITATAFFSFADEGIL